MTNEPTDAAAALKDEGAAYFQAKQFESALRCWDQALALTNDDALAATLHANAAEAHLRLRRWRRAADRASEALALDESHVKARLRRAKARGRLGDWAAALEDAELLEAGGGGGDVAAAAAPLAARLRLAREAAELATLRVPSERCPTLDAALDEARAFTGPRGAVIHLGAGSHDAAVLAGAGGGPLVVVGDRCGAPRDTVLRRVEVVASRCELRHVGVTGGVAVAPGAEDVRLRECVLTHLEGSAVESRGDLAIDGCLVDHCRDGVVSTGGTLTLRGTTIRTCAGRGVVADGRPTLERCHVHDCAAGGVAALGGCDLRGDNVLQGEAAREAAPT